MKTSNQDRLFFASRSALEQDIFQHVVQYFRDEIVDRDYEFSSELIDTIKEVIENQCQRFFYIGFAIAGLTRQDIATVVSDIVEILVNDDQEEEETTEEEDLVP